MLKNVEKHLKILKNSQKTFKNMEKPLKWQNTVKNVEKGKNVEKL